MIGNISTPGYAAGALVYYLFGAGRREEHTDPHLVAGWRHPAELEPPLRPDGSRDFRQLLGLLAQPHAAMGEFTMARPVWHCSLRAAPQDKLLSDEEWAQIAGDVMHRTGLSRRGAEDEGVGGSRSATARITSTWWRCWPARTAAAPAWTSNATGSAKPAGPPRHATGCAVPPPVTGPPPAAHPGLRVRRPPAADSMNRPGDTAPGGHRGRGVCGQ